MVAAVTVLMAAVAVAVAVAATAAVAPTIPANMMAAAAFASCFCCFLAVHCSRRSCQHAHERMGETSPGVAKSMAVQAILVRPTLSL